MQVLGVKLTLLLELLPKPVLRHQYFYEAKVLIYLRNNPLIFFIFNLLKDLIYWSISKKGNIWRKINNTNLIKETVRPELELQKIKYDTQCEKLIVAPWLSLLHDVIHQSLNLGSAQVQILLTTCRRFAMVKISNYGTSWKYG